MPMKKTDSFVHGATMRIMIKVSFLINLLSNWQVFYSTYFSSKVVPKVNEALKIYVNSLFLDDEPLDFNLTRLFDASLKGQASFFISEQVSSKAKNIISLSKNHLESIMEGVKYNIQDEEDDDVTNDSELIKAQCGKTMICSRLKKICEINLYVLKLISRNFYEISVETRILLSLQSHNVRNGSTTICVYRSSF